MTYTAWDYRKLAEYHEQLGNAITAKHYLAHADTLEENARLKAAWDASHKQAMKNGAACNEWRDRAERAEAELAKLRAEANDDDALRERMADILTRTAAALKGEPEPLTLHDWSGLPEIAELALAAERERADRNQEDAERWRAASALFEAGYEMEDGEPAIALFLPEHCDPDAAIDAARRK